jgi:hypothetical protein
MCNGVDCLPSMVRAGGRAINVRHRHETARLRCPLFARYRRQTGHHTDGSIRSSSDSQLHLADLRLVEQTIPGWLHQRRPRTSTLPSDCDLRQRSLGIMPPGRSARLRCARARPCLRRSRRVGMRYRLLQHGQLLSCVCPHVAEKHQEVGLKAKR